MKSLEKFIQQVEDQPYFKFPREIASEFGQIINVLKEQADPETLKRVGLEYSLFSLQIKNPLIQPDGEKSERFTFSYQLTTGEFWPDPNRFDDEDMNYFLIRMRNTKSVFLRARYSDFLFEYGAELPGANRYIYAKELVPSFVTMAKTHTESEHDYDFQGLMDLHRAIEVALLIRNEEFLKQGLPVVSGLLNKYVKNEEYPWLRYISKILRMIERGPFASKYPTELREQCIAALATAAKHFSHDSFPDIAPQFYSELIEWGRLKFFADDEIRDFQRRIGEVYERHAERQDSFISKAHFYETAMEHYKQQGFAERIDQMKVKIREAYEALETSDEMKEFEVKTEIPGEQLRKIQDEFVIDDLEIALEKIVVNSQLFYPKVDVVTEVVQANQEAAPLFSFIHKSTIDDGRKVNQTNTSDDLNRHAFVQQYILDLSLRTSALLVPVFQRLITEKKLGAQDVIRKIESWPLLHRKNAPLVQNGIEKYFNGDYVGCMHILAPQFESTLRRAFQLKCYPTTSSKKGAVQHEKTFNAFLERAEIQQVLGSDFYELINLLMVEQLGFNLRNNVGHGLISIEDCNLGHCTQFIFLFLALRSLDIPDPVLNTVPLVE